MPQNCHKRDWREIKWKRNSETHFPHFLQINALGYFDYRSSLFRIDQGQALDLGHLPLVPCGVLDLKATDQDEAPVTVFNIIVDGQEIPQHTRRYLAPGKYRYYKMPLDPVWIRVESSGKVPQDLLIDLESGKPVEYHVVLLGL